MGRDKQASEEKQRAFETKIANEIETLLCKPALQEFTRTFLEVIKRNDKEANLEPLAKDSVDDSALRKRLAEALIALAWRPRQPLAMVEVLHAATQEHLKRLRDQGQVVTETDTLWRMVTRVLGYMVTCAVSRDWLDRHQGTTVPYLDIPLERVTTIEIVNARLAETPAGFTLGVGSEVQPAYRLNIGEEDLASRETFVAEAGWLLEPTVKQIEAVVFKTVTNEHGSIPELSEVDLDDLNETLRLHRQDPEDSRNYHASVEGDHTNHPLCNAEICGRLREHLRELPIIHFRTRAKDPVLLVGVSEGTLVAKIRFFLKLVQRTG